MPTASEELSRQRPAARAALLFVLCLVCYLANGRTLPFARGGDTLPNRLVPFAILGFGTVALDPFRDAFAAAGGYRWYVQERNGRLVSFYPIGTPLVALPFYVPIYLYLRVTGRADAASLFQYSEPTEKLASAAMAALTVALFFLTVRRRVATNTAFWSSLAFGLGTLIWGTASQILWQHGAVVLTLGLALWLLSWPQRPYWSAAGAGLALALGLVTRPTVAVLYLAGLGCLLLAAGPLRPRLLRAAVFVAAGAPVLALDRIYGHDFYNSSLGGYFGLQLGYFVPAKIPQGLAGLLLSPNRGLFVFTPIALLGFYGIVRSLRRFPRQQDPLIPLFGLAALGHLLVVAAYREWGGGWAFGPRYLVDILPVLGLAAVEAWSSLDRFWRRLTGGALVWSVLVQLNGAFCYPASGWNDGSPNIERQAWNPKRFELWDDFRAWLSMDGTAAPY